MSEISDLIKAQRGQGVVMTPQGEFHEKLVAAVAFVAACGVPDLLAKSGEEQPRDDDGRFASGGGGSKQESLSPRQAALRESGSSRYAGRTNPPVGTEGHGKSGATLTPVGGTGAQLTDKANAASRKASKIGADNKGALHDTAATAHALAATQNASEGNRVAAETHHSMSIYHQSQARLHGG
jgi:hypothetical protein